MGAVKRIEVWALLPVILLRPMFGFARMIVRYLLSLMAMSRPDLRILIVVYGVRKCRSDPTRTIGNTSRSPDEELYGVASRTAVSSERSTNALKLWRVSKWPLED